MEHGAFKSTSRRKKQMQQEEQIVMAVTQKENQQKIPTLIATDEANFQAIYIWRKKCHRDEAHARSFSTLSREYRY